MRRTCTTVDLIGADLAEAEDDYYDVALVLKALMHFN